MSLYQPAKLLQLHVSAQDRYDGRPLHEAVVETCRRMEIAGATVFQGHEGFGDSAQIRRAGPFARHLPMIITIVDSAAKIDALAPVLEGMLDKGVLIVEDVQACRIARLPA